MKKVTKAEAFEAFTAIINDAMLGMGVRLEADNVITVTRFIEQQWEPEEETETVHANGEKLFEVTAKSEGTI